ncbi:unnamed protein product, partial [Rotaria sp. Silwood2]
ETKEIAAKLIKDVLNKYHLRVTQLAISFPNAEAEILLSNELSLDLNEKADGKNDLKVNIHIEQLINDLDNDQYQMKCKIEIPEIFHCTLGTGYQWLKISLINGLYIFHNDTNSEFGYVNCKEKSVEISFEIVKRDKCVVGPIHYSMVIQFLHCEDSPYTSPIKHYENNCKPWQSGKRIIDVNCNRQKRTYEDILSEEKSSENRLPVIKVTKTANNDK